MYKALKRNVFSALFSTFIEMWIQLLFLHYPPTNILENESPFTKIAEEYRAEQVIYSHSHGEARFHDSIQGEYNGILYSLVSGDYLRWKPKKIH